MAETIHRFFTTASILDTSGRRHKGLLTVDELALFEAGEESPLTADYRHFEVYKTNTWGKGWRFCSN